MLDIDNMDWAEQSWTQHEFCKRIGRSCISHNIDIDPRPFNVLDTHLCVRRTQKKTDPALHWTNTNDISLHQSIFLIFHTMDWGDTLCIPQIIKSVQIRVQTHSLDFSHDCLDAKRVYHSIELTQIAPLTRLNGHNTGLSLSPSKWPN